MRKITQNKQKSKGIIAEFEEDLKNLKKTISLDFENFRSLYIIGKNERRNS